MPFSLHCELQAVHLQLYLRLVTDTTPLQEHVLEKVHLYSNIAEINMLFDTAHEEAVQVQLPPVVLHSHVDTSPHCHIYIYVLYCYYVAVARITPQARKSSLLCCVCGEPACNCPVCKFKLDRKQGNPKGITHSCWLRGKRGPLTLNDSRKEACTWSTLLCYAHRCTHMHMHMYTHLSFIDHCISSAQFTAHSHELGLYSGIIHYRVMCMNLARTCERSGPIMVLMVCLNITRHEHASVGLCLGSRSECDCRYLTCSSIA